MTVNKLCEAMSYSEYLDWITFFDMQHKDVKPETDWESLTPEETRAKLGFADG